MNVKVNPGSNLEAEGLSGIGLANSGHVGI